MLSFKSETVWQQPLKNLHLFNKTITGTTEKYQVFQIDIRNQISEKIMSFLDEDYLFPVINDCRYLRVGDQGGYFFTFERKIVSAQGVIVDESNSKADFVRGLDGKDDLYVYAKLHKLHHKYSLNTKKGNNEKKIIKLMDEKVNKLDLICGQGQSDKCVLVEMGDESVSLLYGENLDHDEDIVKANHYQVDHNYVYMLTGMERRQSSPKKNQFNSSPQVSKVRVQAYDKSKIRKGKGYSQLQFNLPKYPIKMDNFQTDLIVAFENSIDIYDIRKITKPFQSEPANEIRDFIYDPNLQRIYLSTRRSLMVYDYI